MTWEGLKLIGMAIPIPQTGGILKASDLLVGFEILETFLRDPSGRGFELAQAKLAGWGVSNISGLGMKTVIIKPNDPFQFAIPYIAKVPGAKTENLLSEQIAPNSNWSWRTTKWSGWMNSIGNSNLMWISQQTDTYNGTFLN